MRARNASALALEHGPLGVGQAATLPKHLAVCSTAVGLGGMVGLPIEKPLNKMLQEIRTPQEPSETPWFFFFFC